MACRSRRVPACALYTETFFCIIQNLAEAEYIVAVFMYMRLLGYPAVRTRLPVTVERTFGLEEN